MTTRKNPYLKLSLAILLAAALLGPAVMKDAQGQEESDKLVEHMEAMNDLWKQLRRKERDKSYDAESVNQVHQMQVHALATMHMEPPMAAKFTGEEKEKFITGYRKEMAKLVTALLDIEIALLEKRHDDAITKLRDLNTIKKDGHDKYVE